MTRALHIACRRFLRSEDGTALVEFAIVLPIFLLLFFGLIDFGRMGAEYVMADKAMQIATRIAVVRPPVCAGVPDLNLVRGTATTPPRFGTSCSAAGFGGTVCAAATIPPCTGTTGDPVVVNEIWTAIAPLMPANSSAANLSFRYDFDPALNFLGGPYVPNVTVELTGLTFDFVVPLGPLAALAGSTGSAPPNSLPFPAMQMTLPGEDLDQGNNG